MLASKLTEKFQATMPKKIRDFLKLSKGDHIVFEIDNNSVIIKKAKKTDIEFLQALPATLSEWNSENDNEAYKNL